MILDLVCTVVAVCLLLTQYRQINICITLPCLTRVSLSQSRGGVGDDSGDESDDDDNDNERESFGPHCDKCGRPGYHVHIGVPERAGSGGGGGSESEGEG